MLLTPPPLSFFYRFIIYGAYSRTDHLADTVDRIATTIASCGGTILLTTLTASVAFALGLISTITAVRYLVIYAFVTILVDFLFQVTFFIALIVLDERRIKDNRRDCCFCCRDETPGSQILHHDRDAHPGKHFADRAMIAYGNFLLKKPVKVIVLVAFAALFGVMAYSTTRLEQVGHGPCQADLQNVVDGNQCPNFFYSPSCH